MAIIIKPFIIVSVQLFTIIAILVYERHSDEDHPRDKAIAMGSMAIITGIVMLVDFALLVIRILKK